MGILLLTREPFWRPGSLGQHDDLCGNEAFVVHLKSGLGSLHGSHLLTYSKLEYLVIHIEDLP